MSNLEIHPLTPDRWADFEKLFGPRGAYGGCWCMFWRLRSRDNARNKGADNKREMKKIVDSGEPPGLLAYVDSRARGLVLDRPAREVPAHRAFANPEAGG